MAQQKNNNDICCPEFNPAPWDEKILEWENKKFIKDSVFTLFYMPINYGSAIRKMNLKTEKQQANNPEWLCLSDHTSKWNMDLYLAVDKEIPDAVNTTLSGKFATKVYEGPYKETGHWSEDFKAWCTKKKLIPEKYYMWYTTCPKCAKKYGKNYVVFVAKVEKE
jgi:hypothetical protein